MPYEVQTKKDGQAGARKRKPENTLLFRGETQRKISGNQKKTFSPPSEKKEFRGEVGGGGNKKSKRGGKLNFYGYETQKEASTEKQGRGTALLLPRKKTAIT